MLHSKISSLVMSKRKGSESCGNCHPGKAGYFHLAFLHLLLVSCGTSACSLSWQVVDLIGHASRHDSRIYPVLQCAILHCRKPEQL